MKRLFVAAAVVIGVGLSSPAFAKHCPMDAKIIDDTISTAKGLSELQKSQAKSLRDKGMALHKAGKHAESIKTLHAAIKILGVAPYKP